MRPVMKKLNIILACTLILLVAHLVTPVGALQVERASRLTTAVLSTIHDWTARQDFDGGITTPTLTSDASGTTVPGLFEAGTVLAGVSKFFVPTGTTVTASMLGNGLIYWDSTTMGGVTVPTISDNAQIVTLKDIQAAGVTIFTENSQAVLNQNAWGTKIWVAPGNLGNQVTISSVMTGTSTFWDVVGSIGSWRVE